MAGDHNAASKFHILQSNCNLQVWKTILQPPSVRLSSWFSIGTTSASRNSSGSAARRQLASAWWNQARAQSPRLYTIFRHGWYILPQKCLKLIHQKLPFTKVFQVFSLDVYIINHQSNFVVKLLNSNCLWSYPLVI